MHLIEAIKYYAGCAPEKAAVIEGATVVSWAELDSRTDKIAAFIRGNGACRGDRVALLLGNTVFHIEAMIGAIKAGCIVTPMSTMLTVKTVKVLLDDCAPALIFTSDKYSDTYPEISDLSDAVIVKESEALKVLEMDVAAGVVETPNVQNLCSLIYSSGTTGRPKGIVHSYSARTGYGTHFSHEYKFTEQSRVLLTTAAYSNGSWMMILPSLYQGATLVMMQKYNLDQFVELLQAKEITHTFLVPTQIKDIFTANKSAEISTSGLQALISAGSYLEAGLKERIAAELQCDFYELYGNTEGVCSILRPEHLLSHVGSVGTSLKDGEIKIVGDDDQECGVGVRGEIVGRNPLMSSGYYQSEALNKELFWCDDKGSQFVRSGDIGEIDKNGFLYVRGRKKEMIISGGFNIFPIDLEDQLMEHNGVQEAAVVGVPHERWGETPVAFVLVDSKASIEEQEILTWFNERVNKHQRLQAVHIVTDFPRNALGKVMKNQLLKDKKNAGEAAA